MGANISLNVIVTMSISDPRISVNMVCKIVTDYWQIAAGKMLSLHKSVPIPVNKNNHLK